MTKQATKNISDRGAIKALEIGQQVTFPIEKLHAIRTGVSDLNTINGSKYLTTTTDRTARTITVTRIS